MQKHGARLTDCSRDTALVGAEPKDAAVFILPNERLACYRWLRICPVWS
jgi:hypothetical protein